MLIDLIVGSAVLLTAIYCWYWLRDPQLRERIEQPKHVFLAQVRRQEAQRTVSPADTDRRTSP